ncbi:MAG TPA: DciA family protein [Jatrophihabitans sp.]|nr:DciA family protein [Jatrophihabitans sp.]
MDNQVEHAGDPAVENVPKGRDQDPADRELGEPDEADLARSVLDDVRAARGGRPGGAGARARPGRGGREARRRIRQENLAGRNRGGYSGPGVDPVRDPQRIGALIDGFVAERGWQRPLADARVFADWAQLVGADVAAHCAPQSLRDGELRIAAESTAWATQLRLLSATLLARLVAELGPHVVTKLVISGPVAPSWKHGGFSIRGARGPRDTYG